MHADILTRMANQIGQFFEAMPERDEALEAAARHIKSYWEPRMRRQFLAAVDAPGGVPELSAFMAEAVGRYRVDIEVGGPQRLPLPPEEKQGGDAG